MSYSVLVQGALEWLEDHQDMSWDEIQEEETKDASAEPPALAPGEEPRSLLCKDCGKKFRSHAQAEFHASKTCAFFSTSFSLVEFH